MRGRKPHGIPLLRPPRVSGPQTCALEDAETLQAALVLLSRLGAQYRVAMMALPARAEHRANRLDLGVPRGTVPSRLNTARGQIREGVASEQRKQYPGAPE